MNELKATMNDMDKVSCINKNNNILTKKIEELTK